MAWTTEYGRKYRAINRARINKYASEWNKANRERVLSYERAYRATEVGRSMTNLRAMEWRSKNKNRHLENQQVWRRKNREKCRILNRKSYWKDVVKTRNLKNKAARVRRAEISDGYIKDIIASELPGKRNGLRNLITPALIEAKRWHLKTTRLLKQLTS